MTVIPISDPKDPRLDGYGDVSDAELLRHRGLFVAEGRLVVERVLADARFRVQSLLLNAASLNALQPILESRRPDAPAYVCASADFERITGFNMHRGCLALVERPPAQAWQHALADSRLVVVLEGVTNADNVGAVFRNAAAFGAGAVLLNPTCCDPLYRKAIRTSMGAVLRVPFARMEPWPDTLRELQSLGFTVVALSPREPALSVDVLSAQAGSARIALLVGTEGAGLTSHAERLADYRVRIPISSAVDSLNLSVAVGIALHHCSRERTT